MNMQLRCIALWGIMLLVTNAGAQTSDTAARAKVISLAAGCPVAETMDAQGRPVFLWQHAFEDGAHDLAMARFKGGKLQEIHCITYGGSREPGCHYAGVAISRGGDWGWHLAWTLAEVPPGKPALRYARMDGAAWVSSPAKRFGNATAYAPQLVVNGERIELIWLEQSANANGPQDRNAVSDDEGRNWE
jgi:hypothetical protein